MTGEGWRNRRVCVGEITGAHGVRGLVRLRSDMVEPAHIVRYGPLADETGRRRFAIELVGAPKGGGQWLARIEGVADRDAAAALRGTRLYVDRACLPAPADDDEFYHADLIGMAVERPDGSRLGTVRAIYDFGAGDVIEVARPQGGPVVVPFTRAVVPVVDIAGGRLVVDPPPGLLEPAEPGGEEDAGAD